MCKLSTLDVVQMVLVVSCDGHNLELLGDCEWQSEFGTRVAVLTLKKHTHGTGFLNSVDDLINGYLMFDNASEFQNSRQTSGNYYFDLLLKC